MNCAVVSGDSGIEHHRALCTLFCGAVISAGDRFETAFPSASPGITGIVLRSRVLLYSSSFIPHRGTGGFGEASILTKTGENANINNDKERRWVSHRKDLIRRI